MKKPELLQIISERIGLPTDDIISKINSEEEEFELELPTVHVFNDEQLTDRLKNHVAKSTPTLLEMAVKEARNNNGLEFEGKTVENLVKAAIEKGKKEAGAKPNEALKEKDEVIEKLRQNIIDIEKTKDSEYETLQNKLSKIETSQLIKDLIPDKLDTQLSKKDLSTLFKNDIAVKQIDGKNVYEEDGEVLRDGKTQNPLTGNQVMERWLNQKGIKEKTETSGRGEGNSKHTTNTKLENIETSEDFYNYCSENNVPQNEQGKLLAEVRKTNTNFFLT